MVIRKVTKLLKRVVDGGEKDDVMMKAKEQCRGYMKGLAAKDKKEEVVGFVVLGDWDNMTGTLDFEVEPVEI